MSKILIKVDGRFILCDFVDIKITKKHIFLAALFMFILINW